MIRPRLHNFHRTTFIRTHMAVRDREWPAYTQWYSCPSCARLWAYQGEEIVVLDKQYALGPALPSPGVPSQPCSECSGDKPVPVLEI